MQVSSTSCQVIRTCCTQPGHEQIGKGAAGVQASQEKEGVAQAKQDFLTYDPHAKSRGSGVYKGQTDVSKEDHHGMDECFHSCMLKDI